MGRRPAASGPHPHEAGAHPQRGDHRHRADQALPLPGEVHLLPDRLAHAQIVPARRAGRGPRRAERVRSLPAGALAHRLAGRQRPPDRQDRITHFGRHLVLVQARLSGMVRAALLRRHEPRRLRIAGRSAADQRDRPAPQRRAGDRDPPGRDRRRRAALAAYPGRDQGADGRSEPGRPGAGA